MTVDRALKQSWPLARARSTGTSSERSAENSTRPAAFLGASATSVTPRLAAWAGSIA